MWREMDMNVNSRMNILPVRIVEKMWNFTFWGDGEKNVSVPVSVRVADIVVYLLRGFPCQIVDLMRQGLAGWLMNDAVGYAVRIICGGGGVASSVRV